MTGLPPNSTIGIVGGGQLGRMTALAAARLGYRCHILTPEPDSPAAQVSAGVTPGDYEDPDALRRFAAAVDVITFEFENVSAEGLDLLASLKPVHPSPAVLRVSQDRAAEKAFLNGIGVATAPWLPVGDLADLAEAASRLEVARVHPRQPSHIDHPTATACMRWSSRSFGFLPILREICTRPGPAHGVALWRAWETHYFLISC